MHTQSWGAMSGNLGGPPGGPPASDPGCQQSPGALVSPVTRQHEPPPRPIRLGPEGPDPNTAHTDSATSFSTGPAESAHGNPALLPASQDPAPSQVLRGCRRRPSPAAPLLTPQPAPSAPASLRCPPSPHVLCRPRPPPLPAARGYIPHLSTFHRPWASLSTFHSRHITHQNSPQSPNPVSPPPGAVTRHLCHRLTPGTTSLRFHEETPQLPWGAAHSPSLPTFAPLTPRMPRLGAGAWGGGYPMWTPVLICRVDAVVTSMR